MSAPKTNIERQTRRHRPALIGVAAVVLFAALMFLMNILFAVDGKGPLDRFYKDDSPAMKDDPGS